MNIENIEEFQVLLLVSKRFRKLTVQGCVIPTLWNTFARAFNNKLKITKTLPISETPQQWYNRRREEVWELYEKECAGIDYRYTRGFQIAGNRLDKRRHQIEMEYRYRTKEHKSYNSGIRRQRKKSLFRERISDYESLFGI